MYTALIILHVKKSELLDYYFTVLKRQLFISNAIFLENNPDNYNIRISTNFSQPALVLKMALYQYRVRHR